MPIRDFMNDGKSPFPTWQHMKLHGTIWNADEWATQGGRVKTDWTQAPFFAYYRNLRVTLCVPSPGVPWCGAEPPESTWFDQGLDHEALRLAREKYMIYDYCGYLKQHDKELPAECTQD
jgi:xyloglucan:xyloglucosyl transferase